MICGFRVQGLQLRIMVAGFGIHDLGFCDASLASTVQGLGFRVQGLGFRV